MGTATVEVSGVDAVRWAAELQATLVSKARSGDSVSPVEVQRSAAVVVAVIGLVFAGVETAKTIWDWWHSRRPEGCKVTILVPDGTKVDVSVAGEAELEIVFQRAASQR